MSNYLLMVNDTFSEYRPSGTGSYTAPTICKINNLQLIGEKYFIIYLKMPYYKYCSLKQPDGYYIISPNLQNNLEHIFLQNVTSNQVSIFI